MSLLGLGLGNLFPMGLSVTVALAPDRAALASGRAVMVTSFAVLLAPLTVGTLADATSLTAALGVVPVLLVLAAVGLALVRRDGAGASRVALLDGPLGGNDTQLVAHSRAWPREEGVGRLRRYSYRVGRNPRGGRAGGPAARGSVELKAFLFIDRDRRRYFRRARVSSSPARY